MGALSDFWGWLTNPDSWSGLDPETGSSFADSFVDGFQSLKDAFGGTIRPSLPLGNVNNLVSSGNLGSSVQALGSFVDNLSGSTFAKHIPLLNVLGSFSDPTDSDALQYLSSFFDNFYQEQDANRLYNAEQAALAREWQEKMASTNYQRSVADLKAAGLNPVLAASGGISSSVPSAPSASNMSSGGDTLSSIIGAFASSVNSLGSVLNALVPG